VNYNSPMNVAVAGDHAGFELKQLLAEDLRVWGYIVTDCGPETDASSDYPDFARKLGDEILSGRAERGILICGSGVGASIAASKIPGIRAAICHDTYSAHQGVEHDDMNLLCLGGRIIGIELARSLVRAFLAAKYEPQERHARRVEKILEIERDALAGKFSK